MAPRGEAVSRGANPPASEDFDGAARRPTDDTVTAERLQQAEAAYRAAFRRSEQAREARNDAIRRALAEGWTQQQVKDATGLTRSRLSQINARISTRPG